MLDDEILALEQKLLIPEVRASAKTLDELISEEFREFGQSGGEYDKAQVVEALIADPTFSTAAPITDFRLLELGRGVVLATYRLGKTIRSSIWRCEDGCWRILFHQGTPSSPEEL
jgi:glyoxylase I family protein